VSKDTEAAALYEIVNPTGRPWATIGPQGREGWYRLRDALVADVSSVEKIVTAERKILGIAIERLKAAEAAKSVRIVQELLRKIGG